MKLKEAYDKIEIYYERMHSVTSTSGRRSNYEKIESIMAECPEVKEFWGLRDSFKYTEKVVRIKSFAVATRSADIIGSWLYDSSVHGYIPTTSCAYIVYLEDLQMIKVGKANDFKSRVKSLSYSYGKITPLQVFEFADEEDAYLMEVLLHKYYKKHYPNSTFVPQDRFENANYTLDDKRVLIKVADEIRMKYWF